VSNLHSVWDSVIYLYPGYPTMPLSTTDWNWYTSTASSMSTKYPVSSTSIKSENYSAWANDSYNLAIKYVYPGFVAGQTPSSTYDNTAIPVVEKNMMLGASRLADLITRIYGTNSLFLQ